MRKVMMLFPRDLTPTFLKCVYSICRIFCVNHFPENIFLYKRNAFLPQWQYVHQREIYVGVVIKVRKKVKVLFSLKQVK